MKAVPVKKKRQGGVVAIEVALGMFGFLLMIFYWMEVSYMGFVSSVMDYTVAEVSREARTAPDEDYRKKIEGIVKSGTDSLWVTFLNTEKIETSVRYFDSVDALEQENCRAEDSDCEEGKALLAPIAIYRISYPYKPLILSLFMDADNSMTISREVIAIQEYERSEFGGNNNG